MPAFLGLCFLAMDAAGVRLTWTLAAVPRAQKTVSSVTVSQKALPPLSFLTFDHSAEGGT